MLNKVMLIGRLGADPELRSMPSGGSVTTVSLATSRRWKDKQTGERREETEWHRVVFFSPLADIVGQYLRKGSQTYVEGRIRTRKWQAQDGQDRYTTEIVADQMQMLDTRSGGTSEFGGDSSQTGHATPASKPVHQATQQNHSAAMPSPPPADYDDFDDDIPF